IVAARDPTAADPVSLAGKSAAIQGLGALEYLLFGSGSEALLASGEESRFRCAYAVAIGGNLVAIADALATDVAPGSPFATAMASPGPANALFPAEADAAADLALSIVTAVELVEDRILVAALGTADDIGQPRAAPLWRSGLTLDFAAGLLGSAARLVDAAGTAAAIPANQAWLPDQIRSETERAIAALPAAGIGAAVADPDLRRQTTLARVIVDNLRTLLAVSLPAALGVALGFNALDGDG
ncbi:MAG: hypothetical protein IT338_03995, partial [Thermomicrobiales bacterium]|nr:hypothetical protein [Thermomicrobiales bacterium]